MATTGKNFLQFRRFFSKYWPHNQHISSRLENPNTNIPRRYIHSKTTHASSRNTLKWVKHCAIDLASFAAGGFALKNNQAEVVHAAEVDKPSRRQQWNFIADVVAEASPSVVHIKGRHPYTGQQVTVSNGSGFIIREDGLILTNAHVVANKPSVSVKLKDGRVYEARVQAVDPISDLATLKIKESNLPALTLGSSADIRPGEFVVALGSPLHLSDTATSGIVSSVNRASKDLGIRNKDIEYIQTDAVINFGNSGGPLVNLDGEVIGINTMKVTPGISFAIPSDYATQFLKRAGEVEKRGSSSSWFNVNKPGSKTKYMGITMLTLTPDIIFNLKRFQEVQDIDTGVIVVKVTPGSPAHRGGILSEDVIISINGKKVESSNDVYKAVETQEILDLVVKRRHQTLMLKVTPEAGYMPR